MQNTGQIHRRDNSKTWQTDSG